MKIEKSGKYTIALS